MATISTGSGPLDSLLGGGVRMGMITDVYGEAGSGKTQLCFTLCANCVKKGDRAVFVDTAGTFRPERISEIFGSPVNIEKITYFRALTTMDQTSAIKKIPAEDPQLVIIDNLTSLFSAEYSGPARHLAVMNHLHELALLAISSGCAVVVTNMVRNVLSPDSERVGRIAAQAAIPSEQREYLGSSVSIYSHMRLKLEILDASRSLFQALLVQPPRSRPARFTITARGIANID